MRRRFSFAFLTLQVPERPIAKRSVIHDVSIRNHLRCRSIFFFLDETRFHQCVDLLFNLGALVVEAIYFSSEFDEMRVEASLYLAFPNRVLLGPKASH